MTDDEKPSAQVGIIGRIRGVRGVATVFGIGATCFCIGASFAHHRTEFSPEVQRMTVNGQAAIRFFVRSASFGADRSPLVRLISLEVRVAAADGHELFR
jgi:hypothetical protein